MYESETFEVAPEDFLEVPDTFSQMGMNIQQYNHFLCNEPYTLLLRRIFKNGAIPDMVLNIVEKIDLNYKLPEIVINVMIHYIYVSGRSWSKSLFENTATDMLAKHIVTFEQASAYVKNSLSRDQRVSSTNQAAINIEKEAKINKNVEDEINELEAKLRSLYRTLYLETGVKMPVGYSKEELLPQLFMTVTPEEKESIWLSIASVWGNKVKRYKTVEELKNIDCFLLATDWFKRPKYERYVHLDISPHDVTLVYQHFRNAQVRKLQKISY
jgi:hypothetical protein